MSLFNRYAAQLAAMPSAPAPQPQQRRSRGLFGRGSSEPGFLDQITAFAQAYNNGTSRSEVLAGRRQQQQAEQEAEAARILGDRLRAQLSPADGPMGSGTGAAPSLEAQMAALDEARLINPAVAEQFAPVVQSRRMADLTRGRPIEEQLAVELNPERAGQSYATQFEDMPLAAGTVRTRGDRPVVAAPRIERFDDRFGSIDPMNPQAGATFSTPRGMTQAEITDRNRVEGQLGIDRDRLALDERNAGFSLSGGQTRFDADGNPIAQVTPMGDPADAARQARAMESQAQQIGSVRNAIGRANDQIGFWTTGPLSGLAAIGGTPAADLAATLDTIEANLSFQALNEMRANSPTGGALGSITERELQLLGSTVASLRQSQSPSQLRQNLQIIERTLNEIEGRSQQAAAAAPQMGGQQSQGSSRRAYDAQGNSYVVRNGQWVRE